MKKIEKPCFSDPAIYLFPDDCENKGDREYSCRFTARKTWENCKYGKLHWQYKNYKSLKKCPWCGGELEVDR